MATGSSIPPGFKPRHSGEAPPLAGGSLRPCAPSAPYGLAAAGASASGAAACVASALASFR